MLHVWNLKSTLSGTLILPCVGCRLLNFHADSDTSKALILPYELIKVMT